ncbi:uncharacterized protein N0V89_012336 [Didymosphaeria variabile]|uniref:Uncharacterized protein n=1 Tax=Didymosphaeria variabile TaxID=1932322 RepID=A0A9W9C4Y1_9PLEO|nr:uncharacterized protein N0V89_012336 [Didymosphaeria variabile]KAJ4344592.1 hypothetical protein N0V89_012336 [Didymosphaeria variabile]
MKTFSVHWDLHIDGILRKANNMVSKAVKFQKGVKLDFEEALYQTNDGLGDTKILDTQMNLVPVSGFTFSQDGDVPETVGTIEVRLYVLRTFGEDCVLNEDVDTYLNNEDEEGEDAECKQATYKTIAPEFMIEFEKNVQELDKKASKAWNKKLTARRPSKEPWAIFRFHYRSKEAIEAQEMELSYNPKTKGKGTEPHILDLDLLPPLLVGAKPVQPNDGASTRADSSTPVPDTPLTLASPFIQRRPSPPPSPLAQRHPPVEDAPSEATVVEEPLEKPDTAVVEEPAEKEGNDIEKTEELSKPIKSAHATPIIATTPITTPVPVAPMLPAALSTTHPAAPALTVKRPLAAPLSTLPEPKRTKSLTITETRRQLKAVKARRDAIVKKRRDLDSELEPYMAQMAREQEKLAKELEEETRMWREEIQELREDSAILAEMKMKRGGE